jgi:hypothetical protein
MDGTEVLTYGEEAAVRYGVQANDWSGERVDVYVAARLPNGRLFYKQRGGKVTKNRSPLLSRLRLADFEGGLSFGALPPNIPEGSYTIYGTLAQVGKNPLQRGNRVSNLENARFELVATTPTPQPSPTPVDPTPTPTPSPVL